MNGIYFSGVYFCDVTLEEMFVVPVNQFNVIIASLVFDVVAISDKMYITSLSNVLQYQSNSKSLLFLELR